jgi:hypothetical protein
MSNLIIYVRCISKQTPSHQTILLAPIHTIIPLQPRPPLLIPTELVPQVKKAVPFAPLQEKPLDAVLEVTAEFHVVDGTLRGDFGDFGEGPGDGLPD